MVFSSTLWAAVSSVMLVAVLNVSDVRAARGGILDARE